MKARTLGYIARILIYILLLITVLLVGWYGLPASVHYHLTESYVFSTSQGYASLALAVLLPKSGAYQSVDNVQVTWDGLLERVAYPALDVYKLQGRVSPAEPRTATFSYDVILSQGSARWEAPILDYQLLPQVDIESDQPELVDQARQLTGGSGRGKVYSIYKFTSSYLHWPSGSRIGGSQSALAAYQTRIGGCGEFANLMVALCRADQVPAQSITGLAFPAYPPFWSATRTWNHPAGAHAWVEVFTGERWEMADPSWVSYFPGSLKRLYFGRSDGSHLSYGEIGQYVQAYAELTAWAEQVGALVGAMSNPLHFVASSSAEGVTVIPSVTLRKGWDGRWFVVVILYGIMLLAIRVIENRLKRNRHTTPLPPKELPE